MTDFHGKRVVVVSTSLFGDAYIQGRSLHLGAACAHEFARRGAHVIAVDGNLDALTSLSQAIQSEGGKIDVIHADIYSADGLRAAAREFEDRWSSLHVLVNAHLETEVGSIEQSSDEAWLRGIHMNLLGPIFASRAFLGALKAAREAAIVHIGSIDGMQGNPRLPMYSVAKGGLVPLTHLMANEFAQWGIRVNCVARGMYVARGEAPSPKFEPLISQTPLGRPAYADEVASAVCFLASSDASYVNGVVLPVDGGRTGITPGTRAMSA